MENKYVYRKHLREPAKFFVSIVLMIIIPYFIIASVLTLTAVHDEKMEMALICMLIGLGIVVFMSLELLLINFVLYRKFKKISVVLTDEGLIYNNVRGEELIPYEDIKVLKFPSIKYMGGWIKIVHNNGNIRLTVVLENIGDMITVFKHKVDEKALTSIYDEKAMYNFFKTANYSDQSWERIYENIKYYWLVILGNLGIAAICSFFITEFEGKILTFAGAFIGPVIILFITEIIFGKKLAKGGSIETFTVPSRDKQYEIKVFKWALGIYLIIFIMMLIMMIV